MLDAVATIVISSTVASDCNRERMREASNELSRSVGWRMKMCAARERKMKFQ